MIFINVDLPAPFSPSTAWISPAATRSEMPSLARTPGYSLVTSWSSSLKALGSRDPCVRSVSTPARNQKSGHCGAELDSKQSQPWCSSPDPPLGVGIFLCTARSAWALTRTDRERPRAVNSYSTRGSTVGYTVRSTFGWSLRVAHGRRITRPRAGARAREFSQTRAGRAVRFGTGSAHSLLRAASGHALQGFGRGRGRRCQRALV